MKKQILTMFTGLFIGAIITGGASAYAAGILAERSSHRIFVDGQEVQMEAYGIAGHNYVKLRDIGKAVGFNVFWDVDSGCVQIETGAPYTGEAPSAEAVPSAAAPSDVDAAKQDKLMPEDIEPQENKKVVQECVGVTCTKLSSPWTVYLSTLIAAHYCCRPYRSHAHGSKVSEIGFIGMEDDFKLCKLAFLYAYDCISSRCRQIRTQKEYSAKALREMCNSYGWGFCRGLSAAFQKQEAEHQEWGLVMVVPQAVEDAVSKMKRSSYKISSTSSMNRQYATMGYADGQEFDMHRRLEPSA